MVKLSELKDDVMVGFPEGHYTLTVKQLKEDLDNIRYDDQIEDWHTVSMQTWTPDAEHMLENYIESESCSLYENWEEIAWDCVSKEDIEKIQLILNKAFSEPLVKNYWRLEEEIELD